MISLFKKKLVPWRYVVFGSYSGYCLTLDDRHSAVLEAESLQGKAMHLGSLERFYLLETVPASGLPRILDCHGEVVGGLYA